VGLSRQNTPAFNDVASKADQTVLKVALDSVGQVLGVVGNSFTRICDFTFHFNTKALEVGRIPHFTDTTTGGQ
jgi:hypothetical protein